MSVSIPASAEADASRCLLIPFCSSLFLNTGCCREEKCGTAADAVQTFCCGTLLCMFCRNSHIMEIVRGGVFVLVRRWAAVMGGFLLSMMIPYIVTLVWSGQVEVRRTGLFYSGDMVMVEGEEMDAENFLIYVLAEQIGTEAPTQAKEAQAIAARTNLYKTMDQTQSSRAEDLGIQYLSLAEMKEDFGDEFSQVYQEYKDAVSATAGLVLTYEGELIDALFHRASAGKTRTMGEEFPYLVSVESNDQLCDGYLTVMDFSGQKLAEAVNGIDSGRQVSAEGISEKIQIVNREDTGYVTAVQIDQQLFTGDELAGALELPSTAFSFSALEDGVRITCTGSGHGYGLSQTGASRMAEEGKTKEEILSYYYPGTEITLRQEQKN